MRGYGQYCFAYGDAKPLHSACTWPHLLAAMLLDHGANHTRGRRLPSKFSIFLLKAFYFVFFREKMKSNYTAMYSTSAPYGKYFTTLQTI
jgi:hypothetical protein